MFQKVREDGRCTSTRGTGRVRDGYGESWNERKVSTAIQPRVQHDVLPAVRHAVFQHTPGTVSAGSLVPRAGQSSN